jgi:hypothetical protein
MGTDYQLMCKTCFDKFKDADDGCVEDQIQYDLVYFYFYDVHVIQDEVINDKTINIVDLINWLNKHQGHKIYFGC